MTKFRWITRVLLPSFKYGFLLWLFAGVHKAEARDPEGKTSPYWAKKFEKISLGRPNPFDLKKFKADEKTDFFTRWNAYQNGMLESTAELLGAFGEWDKYLLGRDAEWLLYANALGARILDEPAALERLHSLAVGENAQGSELFADYIKQEGISTSAMKQGKKALLIDVCYRGGIIQGARETVSEEYRSQIQGFYLYTANDRPMWSRAFAEQQSPGSCALEPQKVAWGDKTNMQRFEWNLPHFFQRSGGWERIRGKLVGSGVRTAEKPEEHTAYVRSMVEFWSEPRNISRFRERVAMWRDLRKKVDRKDREGARAKLQTIMRKSGGEVVVRDFCDFFPGFLLIEEFNLHDPRKYLGNPEDFSSRLREWEELNNAKDPQQSIRSLFKNGEFRIVLEYLEKARFPEDITEATMESIEVLSAKQKVQMADLIKIFLLAKEAQTNAPWIDSALSLRRTLMLSRTSRDARSCESAVSK